MAFSSARYPYLLLDIGAIGSASDEGTFEASGIKDALYKESLSLPEDTDLPNTD